MIVVIDDRETRMRHYLGSYLSAEHPYINLEYENESVEQLTAFLLKEAEPPAFLHPADIVCVHSSGFFEKQPSTRLYLADWCRQNGKALVTFSGGNSGVNTLNPGWLYASDAETLYQRISWWIQKGERVSNPNLFLLGEHYLLNQLLQLRRALYLSWEMDRQYELLDEQDMYPFEEIRGVFNAWEQQTPSASLEDWLFIINRAIHQLHAS